MRKLITDDLVISFGGSFVSELSEYVHDVQGSSADNRHKCDCGERVHDQVQHHLGSPQYRVSL